MMILDACCFVGRWPYSPMRYCSVEDLLRLMDKAGIARALVSPISGIFFRNCQEANEELFFEIGTHADRLMLAAACNPSYPGWQSDLKRSREILSASAIRLFPNYHGYDLSLPETHELAAIAASYGIPVIVSIRMQDERHHPPVFRVPAVPSADLASLAKAHPETRFVMSMGRYGEIVAALKATSVGMNLWADVAGVQGPTKSMQKLSVDVGIERILFGTELMLQYALPARLKVEFSDLTPEDRQKIYSGNLAKLLKIHV